MNWTVASTTGGASATFSDPKNTQATSISGALPTMQVNVGPTAGNCSISGTNGAYKVSSTATVTVKAQATDDTSKAATFLFSVCASTTHVIVAPAYQQAYRGQPMTLQSWVLGNTDETGTWRIDSQPSNGDGVLADTINRDTVFTATVTGRYQVSYTSRASGNQIGTAIVYVSPNAMPSYSATPNQTRPHECYRDPQLTGGDYEVGAGKAFTTISAVPAITSWTPGTIMRIWNSDTTNANPSVYHEYFQVKNSGTAAQPILVCGVPDAAGNLPILDGKNSVGQSDVSTGAAAGYGILTLWAGPPTPYGYWQDGAAGPNYVSLTGLHLRNASPGVTYTPPGGGSATPWLEGAACVNLRSGAYVDVSGNDMDTCTNGLFTAENSNSGWVDITQNVTVMGNHIHGSGWSTSWSEHQVYFQSFFALFEGNRVDKYTPAAQGSDIKWRGVEGIFRYNYLDTQAPGSSGPARDFDLVENQDAAPYTSFEDYLVKDGLYSLGDTAGANVIAAYQESAQKDFIYGNLIGRAGSQQIHYAADNVPGMTNRNGTLYFYSNTMPDAEIVFDTGENQDGFNPIFPQRVDARNNIFWPDTSRGYGNGTMAINGFETLILSASTNLYQTGAMSIATPIDGINWNTGAVTGFAAGCDSTPCFWPLSSPIDTHVYGLSSANFLTTSTKPFDPTTLVPPAGSAAIGAGTALTGAIATLPVRWQYSLATSTLTPRRSPLTIGAEDEGSANAVATPGTPAFTPAGGSYSSTQSVSISTTTASAKIYYTVNGTTPTTSSTLYSGPISVSASETVKAIAVVGSTSSAVGSAAYTISTTVATPAFTPASGTYTSTQSVSISTTTASAKIYYTVNGATPTTSSTLYSGPISISVSETVKAIAVANSTSSAVGSATYTMSTTVATPTFTPAGGSYSAAQSVSISTTTANAKTYYTTNGTTPTTSSTLYSGPIIVSASETMKAVSVVSSTASAVSSATYNIGLIASATPKFVQECHQFVQYGTVTSCTLSGVGAGHTLVIGIAGGVIGVAPTASSGTPTLAVTDKDALSAYLVPNTTSGSVTITFKYSSYRRLWLSVAEYANVAASPLDGIAAASSSAWAQTAINSPTFKTTKGSDLVWSFCAVPSDYSLSVGTAPLSWTKRPVATGSGYTILLEDGLAPSAGTYFGEATGPTGGYNILAVALKP
ncbi:MAG TPA: chitobiase/beta-hexosaminidase C-terminal domain-containing protein [Terracidiphilus sp.]